MAREKKNDTTTIAKAYAKEAYPYGFTSDIRQQVVPPGLSEKVIRTISAEKGEPPWLLAWRLRAYAHWLKMKEPTWGNLQYEPVDYQKVSYYAAPKRAKAKSLDEVDPTILAKKGIIFCAFSEAVQSHPSLVQAYLGKVVPYHDNFFAALNAAVFTDGSFCYIPAGVRCPMELSTYFRINAANTGQFERTLIIAEEGAYVSYLEGCTAPMREEHQLHAAVVEIYAKKKAEVRYATIQNWYPGDAQGKGGVYNFVTKRGLCAGEEAKISWTQLETGSAITWKYPSCILKGARSKGEFYSVAISKGKQQMDTGTKMVHIGAATRSRIIAKGISLGQSSNTYRGLVKIGKRATDAYNFSQCDSLLIGDSCSAHTLPYIEGDEAKAEVQHEATTSEIDADQLFYCQQRGLSEEKARTLLAIGFCREVLAKLPMEFAMEGEKLLALSLEGGVG